MEAQQILQNVIDTNGAIAVFEAQERSLTSIVAMLFSPLSVFWSAPLIRPFKIKRIIFTYLIPIVPLCVIWDGVVSSLRTYSLKEMNDLIEDLDGTENYEWEINRVKSGPIVLLYLLGTKKA